MSISERKQLRTEVTLVKVLLLSMLQKRKWINATKPIVMSVHLERVGGDIKERK